jgi:hypothetical protein
LKIDIAELIGSVQRDVTRAAGNALAAQTNPPPAVLEGTLLNKLKLALLTLLPAFAKKELNDVLETFILTEGSRDDASDTQAWDGSLDEALETRLEPLAEIIGQNGLGNILLDTRLHEPKRTDELANEIAKLAATALTSAQFKDEVLQFFDLNGLAKSVNSFDKKAVGKTGRGNALELLGGVAGFFDDEKFVKQTVELLGDEDEILAYGAANNLGFDGEQATALVDACRAWATTERRTWVKIAVDAVMGRVAVENEPSAEELIDNAPNILAATEDEAAELAALLGDAPDSTVTEDAPPLDSVKVLEFLATNSVHTERSLAGALKCSRAQIGKMRKGEAKISDEQGATLAGLILAHANELEKVIGR